ncbi:dihydrofolate reductase [Candidatus Curtissbacteria bacterium]|nr:dihydrofolate reductase [Candidatus Curtissbacteria bacterium]
MREVFLFMMISLDGYFEGPKHDLSWHNVDAEFNKYAIAQTKKVDTLLFGRRTYELMRDYWPTAAAVRDDPIVAGLMNNKPKVVFSRTLKKVEETNNWKNVVLVSKNASEYVRKIKKQSGGALAIYGSNNFCVSLIKDGLIDEFRIMVNPVAIGDGTPLFAGMSGPLNLKLTSIKGFKNGNVLASYKPRS